MFGKFQRRNNRKARLSGWFAHERDSDMQVFDVDGVACSVSAYIFALARENALRRASSGNA